MIKKTNIVWPRLQSMEPRARSWPSDHERVLGLWSMSALGHMWPLRFFTTSFRFGSKTAAEKRVGGKSQKSLPAEIVSDNSAST